MARRTELGRGGLILIQALVLVMLMALVATAVLQCVFARHMAVHRANDSDSKRATARGVESRVYACLSRTPFGSTRADCDLDPYRACLPQEADGHRVTVSAQWTEPDCALSIAVAD